MVWCVLVYHGTVLYSLVWCVMHGIDVHCMVYGGTVWYVVYGGRVWYSLVWHGVHWYSSVWRSQVGDPVRELTWPNFLLLPTLTDIYVIYLIYLIIWVGGNFGLT